MALETKINLKKYLLFSVPSTAICFLLSKNSTEIVIIMVVYLSTLFNQYLLVKVIRDLIDPEKKKNNLVLVTLFVVKMVVILAALSLSVHFMGKRVIIPLLNYVILIFVLIASLKKVKGNEDCI